MPENPLLPNDRLRALLRLMLLMRQAARRQPLAAALRGLEAVLAPVALQAEPQDSVLADAALVEHVRQLRAAAQGVEPGVVTPLQGIAREAGARGVGARKRAAPFRSGFDLAAGAALAARTQPSRAVAFAVVDPAQPAPDLPAALAVLAGERLPAVLLLAPGTARAASRRRNLPTYAALTAACRPLRLPVLPTDGGDAVALYRVVQESALRARQGDGPAIVWAVDDAATAARTPVERMRRYLAVRGISPQG